MTSAQVVETSVTNNSSFQNYTHPDDHTIRALFKLLLYFSKACCSWMKGAATKEKTHFLSPFQNATLTMMIYRKRKIFSLKYVTFCSLNTVGTAGHIVIDVVPSVAGGIVLILVLIVIWWRVRIRCRNNDYPRLIDDDPRGRVDEIVNDYPDTSEGSELTSGRNSASFTKPPSSVSSCSDITEPKKDSFNSKVKIKRYAEGIC